MCLGGAVGQGGGRSGIAAAQISKENRGGLRWAVLTWRARRDRPGGRHDDDRESCDSRYQ